MGINPLFIKEYIKSNSLRRTKTDKLDAIAIVEYMLANYPSVKAIANMNVCFYGILCRKSHSKFTMDKVVQLRELARNMVGVNTDRYQVELEMLIALYSHLDNRIDELDKQITAIVTEINPSARSIVGNWAGVSCCHRFGTGRCFTLCCP